MEQPVQLSFQDTELAFRHLDDKALRRRFRLFRMIDSPFLTRIGPSLVTLALKIGLPITGIIKRTIFDIFVGGTSIKDTESRSNMLFESGVRTILDYSVEGKKDDPGFDSTRDEIIDTLRYGANREAVAFSAMKVTGIADFAFLIKNDTHDPLTDAERASLERSKARMEQICTVAHELGHVLGLAHDDCDESGGCLMRSNGYPFNDDQICVARTLASQRTPY